MSLRRSVFVPFLVGSAAAAFACGGEAPVAKSPSPVASASPAPAVASSGESIKLPTIGGVTGATPSENDAKTFLAQVDADLRRLWVARDRASWVSETYITDDTGAMAAAAEEETAGYMTRAIKESRRWGAVKLPDDLARQMMLLRLSQSVPAPSDAAERNELATIEARMRQAYGAGKYCPPRLRGKCWHIDEIEKTLRTSRNPDELKEAWEGWHEIGKPMRADYKRYVELANKGAKEIGFDDMGALWRAAYDMTPKEFEDDVERLWTEVKPMYDELHCYVRSKLRQKYGAKIVPEHAPIRADLLGNIWAQEWNNVADLAEPYKGEPPLDVDKKLVSEKYDAVRMVKLGEKFFTSLGFDPLPDTFWKRSQLTRPRDREVICHAEAADVTWSGDLRVKMCIQPTWEDLVTIHHELGHDFYYQSYFKLPILFQAGANGGFHEAIGDTLALSVTPGYLKSVGLLDAIPKTDHGRINALMRSAMEKVAFLPFGLLVDKWRWDVFAGKTPPDKYNEAWWALRTKYQGVAPPTPRGEEYFDPGAKFHVPASAQYMIYFLARIYQFQFHRALCKAAGYSGPLDQCSIYGNKEAGEKLRAMLALGASKPWQDALAAMSGERRADATAMLEFYAPLRSWIKDQIKGEQCGW